MVEEYIEKLKEMEIAYQRAAAYWDNASFLWRQTERAWENVVDKLEESRLRRVRGEKE